MASLRDFLYGYNDEVAVPKELVVYNTNITTIDNGGYCCSFTVPGNTLYIAGELWGGGGAGDGSCCYGNGFGGSQGGYVEFFKEVTPGDNITICAAGSTISPNRNTGTAGNDSYICKAGSWCIFAHGGCRGCVNCNGGSCYWCRCSVCICRNKAASGGAQAPGAGFEGTPASGDSINAWCGADSTMFVEPPCRQAGYGIAQGGYHMQARISPVFGQGCLGGVEFIGNFPGGGGLSAQTCCANTGGACSGGPGAGGLAYIIYE